MHAHAAPTAPRPGARAGSAAAGLGLVLAALAACGPRPSSSQRGQEIYATMGCVQCHGKSGAGTPSAPPLTELAQHWDRAGLAAYLESPRAYLEKDARLAALKQRYGTEMPALGFSEADRLAVADHLLALPAAAPGP